MKKNHVIIGVVALVAIGGLWYWNKKKNESLATTKTVAVPLDKVPATMAASKVTPNASTGTPIVPQG